MNEVLEMAKNAVRHITSGEFSAAQTSDAIRQSLIELNGGSEKINFKKTVVSCFADYCIFINGISRQCQSCSRSSTGCRQ